MLRLITGKAGSGKTASIMDEIKSGVQAEKAGYILIVPEQYSHEAERELAARCGDTMSLYAEVLSFTGLSRLVFSRAGGIDKPALDKGGRLMCMALVMFRIGSRLSVYRKAISSVEMQQLLVRTIEELKTASVTPDMLDKASRSPECDRELSAKLSELSVIMETYNIIIAESHVDPTDRLSLMARKLPASGMCRGYHYYVDGFTDFTGQQFAVLKTLMACGADLTVCLTLDGPESNNEIFSLARRSAFALNAVAKELDIPCVTEKIEAGAAKSASLAYYTENIFGYPKRLYDGDCSGVSILLGSGITDECEIAAAKVLELVRSGCRWKDIAVAVRGFDSYASTLSSIFAYYGVPLFLTRREDMISKPIPALIKLAYDITGNAWDRDDVISYIRTGLAGIGREEADELENYIFLWELTVKDWKRAADWSQNPDGNADAKTLEEKPYTDEERLKRINAFRRKIANPLLHFEAAGRNCSTASEHAGALVDFLREIRLPQTLALKASELSAAGDEGTASEYSQIWDIVCQALEQTNEILADTPMSMQDFGRLFIAALSAYDIALIPVSLDRVSAGDFDRMRRRNLKHLIVLGADDSRLPAPASAGGVFSEYERSIMTEKLDIPINAGENEIWREFSLIYNTLTLPSQSITFVYSKKDNGDDKTEASSVVQAAEKLMGAKPIRADITQVRLAAPGPAFSVAAGNRWQYDEYSAAAAEYFRNTDLCRFNSLERAQLPLRGSLSSDGVNAVYGNSLSFSASKAEVFNSCPARFYYQHGLRAKPRKAAGFKASDIGTMMHAILQNTLQEINDGIGFKEVSREEVDEITERYIALYSEKILNNLEEKAERFKYIFRRLSSEIHAAVQDSVDELRNSDFRPVEFEHDFSKDENAVYGTGADTFRITGIADRIDAWEHDGKTYYRIVDYKTGAKQFRICNIVNGKDYQLLMYLQRLKDSKAKSESGEMVAAGIEYVPAKEPILSFDNRENAYDIDKVKKAHADKIKRQGLILDEPEIIKAWESGEMKEYLPKESNKYGFRISSDRLRLLTDYITDRLIEMSTRVRSGEIAASPVCSVNSEDACRYCDFVSACRFKDGMDDEKSRIETDIPDAEVWDKLEGGDSNG